MIQRIQSIPAIINNRNCEFSEERSIVETEQSWHSCSVNETLQHLDVSREGLSQKEAEQRLAEQGPNRLSADRGTSWLRRLGRQFNNALIHVLLASAVITLLLEHYLDMSVILGVVIINALVGLVQEGKAEKALAAIRDLLPQNALVRRDGQRQSLDAASLVPGDVVWLQSGDRVPADMRLLEVQECRVDEAILTGESMAVDKQTDPVAADAALADRSDMAYSGTMVVTGTATGVVTATGEHTEVGRISHLLGEVETLTTPLLRQMERFAGRLALATLVVSAGALLAGWLLRGYALEEMFLAAVGIAVAAIPEGLPPILTITLAIGVQRMAQRNAIIRELPAVEALGSVTVICSDKTGTLTRNEMTVTDIVSARARYRVSGAGYGPEGDVTVDDGERASPESAPAVDQAILAGVLCNDAALRHRNGDWLLSGDPSEGALLTLGMKWGLGLDQTHQHNPRVDAIPFESENRFMATLNRDHAHHHKVYVKGAPERLLAMCENQLDDGGETSLDRAFWEQAATALAGEGKRVLALACKPLAAEVEDLNYDDVQSGLTLLALFALEDPPRTEARESIARAREAGIRVKMITGDHAITAQAIGHGLQLGEGQQALTGQQLDQLDDRSFAEKARETDLFARTSPEHKLRLVMALQAGGEVVAMTGDGVNDAPALKRADVGVAMGHKGTDAARQAGRVVLADDNFASIVHAVEEGRIVYDNLKKAILFTLPTSGGEALAIIAAILLGVTMPITPVQILWVNMVTAVTLAIAIAFEPAEQDVMQRPPRAPDEPLLSGFLVWRVVFVAVAMVVASFGLFLYHEESGANVEIARTIAVNTLVMCEVVYLLNTRVLSLPALSPRSLMSNPWVWYAIGALMVLQVLFTYAPPFQHLFETRSLSLSQWAEVVLAALLVFAAVEIEKLWVRGHSSAHRPSRRPPMTKPGPSHTDQGN
ncbi:cation-transporting P-type ATPase [Marinobacteraceae bacterium S3BR75-40.1]